MSIFAIGDLHLPGGDKKPMDVFGPHWEHHFERICADNHMSAADLKPYLDNGFVTVVRQQMLRDKATDLVRQAAHITQ